jgi:YHS domain-containing protein
MFSKSQILAAAALGLAVISGASITAGAFSDSQTQGAIAADGYDLVSFFGEGNRPVAGSAKFTATHEGKPYRFATQANADAFKADPAAYLPRYGGHCAWAAAQGYIAPGDPKHATVVDGKLYFNYDAKVQADWSKDIPGFITKADRNWPNIASEAS